MIKNGDVVRSRLATLNELLTIATDCGQITGDSDLIVAALSDH
jgi:hypothetical protein